jgi:VWFA-related protein
VKKSVLALMMLVAHTALAQQSEVINVEVTSLDVVVTDNKGKRVTGLTAADFEVMENGKVREITNLSEVSRDASSTQTTIQPAPRRILLIVDNGSIALPARKAVFAATRTTLERLLVGPSDRLAIATISRSITQRLVWTTDKAEILKTLAVIEKDGILQNTNLLQFEHRLTALVDDADWIASRRKVQPEPGTPRPEGSAPGGGFGSAIPPIEFEQFMTAGRAYAATATTETKQVVSSLHAALTAFDGIPDGRKIIIIAGGGLPLNSSEAIFQRIETVRRKFDVTNHVGVKGARQGGVLTQTSMYDITDLIDALAEEARSKGVAFYAVNPVFGDRQTGGIDMQTSADMNAEFSAMKGQLDGFGRLTAATGGTAMIGGPAGKAFTEIISDLDSYYSVGYRASGPLTPKSKIVVKVRKGLSARATFSAGLPSSTPTRSASVAAAIPGMPTPTTMPGLDLEVADRVAANHKLEPENPLGISVVLNETPAAASGSRTVPMKIMIPVESLEILKADGNYTASIAVFISVGGPKGNGVAVPHEKVYRWSELEIDDAMDRTISLAVDVKLEADQNSVSVGVLDRNSGTAGYARTAPL